MDLMGKTKVKNGIKQYDFKPNIMIIGKYEN